jgi:hypothetical protein
VKMEETFININRNKLIFIPSEINTGWGENHTPLPLKLNGRSPGMSGQFYHNQNLRPLPSPSKKFQTRVKAYPILRSIIYTKYTTVEINPQYLDQLLH